MVAPRPGPMRRAIIVAVVIFAICILAILSATWSS
jgi:hypothetical protein